MPDDWRTEAACIDQPTRWFFPASIDTLSRERALRICQSCDVRIDCLKDALAEEDGRNRREVAGIRGGLTEDERARVLLKRRRQRYARRVS